MKVLLVLACFVATSLASPNWFGNSNNNNNGGGMQNGNLWSWLMNGQNGNGNNNGWGTGMGHGNQQQMQTQWGMHSGMMGQNTMFMFMMQLMQQAMMQKKGGYSESSDDSSSEKEHLDEFEKYMKQKMIAEMTKEIMMQTHLKKSQKEFHNAVRSLCWAKHAIDYYYAEQMNNGTEPTEAEKAAQLTDAEVRQYKEQVADGMEDEEGTHELFKLLTENKEQFDSAVYRIMEWVCDAGKTFEDALDKMESSGDKCKNDDRSYGMSSEKESDEN